MKSIQDLRERRHALAKNLHELLEKSPGDKWNGECQNKYDTGMKEIDDLDHEIGRIQALHEKMADDALDNALDDAGKRHKRNGDEKSSVAIFTKWLRQGDKGLTAEDWATIRNTMSTTTQSEGGYTVATEVAKVIADALKAYGGMRAVSTVLQTAQGNPINYPTSDGTSETGEQLAENVSATGADPTFGVVALNTYKYSSKVVAVPFELLQDSSVDIEAFIRRRLVTRIGRITNTKFTTGTGTNEPRGVVTAAGAGKVGTTGQTLTVIYDDLVDLVHSVDPAYRDLNNCRFMMADSSLKVIRKLKDTTGRPIFLPGYDLNAKMPDTILGYGVQINQDVAVMAASAKSILFGDFTFYVIRDALEMSLFRFTDSAYAKLGQVGFLMFSRNGGNYVDVGGGVKYYQNSAT
jgi:HK97 family phage major capsid protein